MIGHLAVGHNFPVKFAEQTRCLATCIKRVGLVFPRQNLIYARVVMVAVRTCMVVACSSIDRLIVAAARSRLAYR